MADSIKIKMPGATKLKAKMKRIIPAVELALQREILDAAGEVRKKAIIEIERPKTGRQYTRRRRNKQFITWTASAPGEAPAKKTGENEAKIKVRKWNRAGKPGAKIVAPNIYRLLERGLAKIAPRPLFGPAVSAYRKVFKDRLDDTVSKALGVAVRR